MQLPPQLEAGAISCATACDPRVLADGLAEGRRAYANIMKYIRMGTSSNFGNMLSMAPASVMLPFLPLLPLQILRNNLIYDLSEIGIPFDRADEDDLARPQPWDIGSVLRFTLVMGPLPTEVFRTAWFVESIVTQILVIFIIRGEADPDEQAGPGDVLTATSLGAAVLACAIAHAARCRGRFRCASLADTGGSEPRLSRGGRTHEAARPAAPCQPRKIMTPGGRAGTGVPGPNACPH